MAPSKSILVEKIQTALISIGTTAVVGCCAFLFNVNAALARIEQSLSNQVVITNQHQTKMNKLEIDVVDLKTTAARLEAKQKPQ